MRLGEYCSSLEPSSTIAQLYQQYNRISHESGQRIATERHRHRYEVNPQYVEILQRSGLIVAGTDRES